MQSARKNSVDNQMNDCSSWQSNQMIMKSMFYMLLVVVLWYLYLLLVNFGPSSNTKADGLNIPATYSQMEGTALGLVWIVDVNFSLVA